MQTKIKIDQHKPLAHQSNLVLILTLAHISFVLFYRRLSKYIFCLFNMIKSWEVLRCLQNFVKTQPNFTKKEFTLFDSRKTFGEPVSSPLTKYNSYLKI